MSSRTIRTSEYYREGSGWRDTQGRFVASSYVYGNAAPDLFGEEEEERERLARREAPPGTGTQGPGGAET